MLRALSLARGRGNGVGRARASSTSTAARFVAIARGDPKGSLFLAGVGSAIVWGTTNYYRSTRAGSVGVMERAFGRGGRFWGEAETQDAAAGGAAHIPRPDLEADLREYLVGRASPCDLGVIVAPAGSGVGAALRRLVSSSGGGLPGVVYVPVPSPPPTLREAILEAFGLPSKAFNDSYSDSDNLDACLSGIEDAAAAHARRTGRAAVLVLDNVDSFLKDETSSFYSSSSNPKLGKFGARCAEKGHLRVVLVIKDGEVLERVRAKGSGKDIWAHVKLPYDVPDMSDAKAALALAAQGVPKAEAEEIVRTFTGGRMSLVSLFRPETVGGPRKELAAVRRFYEGQVAERAASLGKGARPLLAALLASPGGKVESEAARAACASGSSDKDSEKVLGELIEKRIVHRHGDGSVSFYARYVETYFRGKWAAA